MEQTKTYKGIDLLEKLLEFIAMTPDENDWNYRALAYNRSREIRLRRIDSLLTAFGLKNSDKTLIEKTGNFFNPDLKKEIQSILNGDFIRNREMESFSKLTDFATHYLEKTGYSIDTLRPVRQMELIFIYPKMLNYKIKLREMLEFNSGWLEASSTFAQFHIALTDSIISNLEGKSTELDQALELFLNPANLSFTEKELMDKYHYPTDDLDEIDMDNY